MRTQLWRAVVLYRVLAAAYAVGLVLDDDRRLAHPAAGVVVVGVLAGWTAVTAAAYLADRASPVLVTVDVAVAVAAVALTRYVDLAAHIDHGAATLASAWGAAPVLAAAVAAGPWGGLAAGAAVATADLAERAALARMTVNGAVLLLLAGVVAGYVARLVVRAERTASEAAATERVAASLAAATEERERMAADIHDSVLQVLAYISRQGRRLGGPATELATLAGDQEVALRALVAAPAPAGTADGTLDVRTLLPVGGTRITVALPDEAVPLPAPAARSVAAAAREALANVEHHAGAGARAWVLLEDDGREVTVSVRDDGCGMATERLDEAARAGRLGVARSIVARAAAVGGSATVTSAPGQGTEVEIRVPRS